MKARQNSPSKVAQSKSSNRISFFDAQAGHRRAAHLWSLPAGAVLLALGGGCGVLILLVLHFYLVLAAGILPLSLHGRLERAGYLHHLPLRVSLPGGLLFAAGAGALISRTLGGAALGAVREAAGLRAPDAADPEERQLVNTVEEMALAAGLPAPPRVLLMEGELLNAGMAAGRGGQGQGEFTLLFSRGLLDRLDRDQTQGVAAHLMAAAVNGDARLAAGVLTLLETTAFFSTLFDLPFSPRARRTLGELLRLASGAGRGEGQNPPAPHRVAADLAVSLQPEGLNDLLRFMERRLNAPARFGGRIGGSVFLMLLFPVILSRLAVFLLFSLSALFVTGPLLAFGMRARRGLADATAVQLTRHPDGLARALIDLAAAARPLPPQSAGWAAEMLFITGAEAEDHRRLARLREETAAGAEAETRRHAERSFIAEVRREGQQEGIAQRHSLVYRFHPSLHSRILRLKRLGAAVDWPEGPDWPEITERCMAGVLLLLLAGAVWLGVRS